MNTARWNMSYCQRTAVKCWRSRRACGLISARLRCWALPGRTGSSDVIRNRDEPMGVVPGACTAGMLFARSGCGRSPLRPAVCLRWLSSQSVVAVGITRRASRAASSTRIGTNSLLGCAAKRRRPGKDRSPAAGLGLSVGGLMAVCKCILALWAWLPPAGELRDYATATGSVSAVGRSAQSFVRGARAGYLRLCTPRMFARSVSESPPQTP